MKEPVFAKGLGHERRGIRCDETEPRRVHRSKCGRVYWAIEPTDCCWEQLFAQGNSSGPDTAFEEVWPDYSREVGLRQPNFQVALHGFSCRTA